MDLERFEALKRTFPWNNRAISTKSGLLIQVIDATGAEVPITTMVEFLAMITRKLSPKAEQGQATASGG